jgi:hypothetical protein
MQRSQAQECPQSPAIPGSAQSHLRNLGENSRLARERPRKSKSPDRRVNFAAGRAAAAIPPDTWSTAIPRLDSRFSRISRPSCTPLPWRRHSDDGCTGRGPGAGQEMSERASLGIGSRHRRRAARMCSATEMSASASNFAQATWCYATCRWRARDERKILIPNFSIWIARTVLT